MEAAAACVCPMCSQGLVLQSDDSGCWVPGGTVPWVEGQKA